MAPFLAKRLLPVEKAPSALVLRLAGRILPACPTAQPTFHRLVQRLHADPSRLNQADPASDLDPVLHLLDTLADTNLAVERLHVQIEQALSNPGAPLPSSTHLSPAHAVQIAALHLALQQTMFDAWRLALDMEKVRKS